MQLLIDFKLRGKFCLCRKAHLNFSVFTIQPQYCYMEGNSLGSTQKMVQSFFLLGKGLKGIFKLQKFELIQQKLKVSSIIDNFADCLCKAEENQGYFS